MLPTDRTPHLTGGNPTYSLLVVEVSWEDESKYPASSTGLTETRSKEIAKSLLQTNYEPHTKHTAICLPAFAAGRRTSNPRRPVSLEMRMDWAIGRLFTMDYGSHALFLCLMGKAMGVRRFWSGQPSSNVPTNQLRIYSAEFLLKKVRKTRDYMAHCRM